MKQSTIRLSVFLVALLGVVVLAFAPVSAARAEEGNDSSQTTSDDASDPSVSDTESEQEDTTKTEDTNETEHARNAAALFRREGADDLRELRKEHASKSIEQRQKTCGNIKNAVDRKLTAFNNNADRHLSRLDSVFTKLKDFQTANNLPVSNYDALVAAATAKQTAATEAVASLKLVGTTLDCSSSDPAAMLSSTKVAAKNARDALKDYRKSLKDIVVALAQAKGDTDTADTTDGGTN